MRAALRIRESKKLTRNAVVREMARRGVEQDYSHFRRFELGESKLDSDRLQVLSEIYQVSINELLEVIEPAGATA